MARVLATLFTSAAAVSISNCGSDSDHFKIDTVVLDADADKGPRKGKPFTITLSGTMDEAHQHGRVVVDAALKALGIVDEPVTASQAYDFYPGLASGPLSLTIGPFTFPRGIPGVFDFTGRITLENERAEPVTCLDLALHIPKIFAEESELETMKVCAPSDSDHISNIVSDNNTCTMDLDEDLDFVNLGVDISVKAPLLPAVSVQLTELPIALSPAIPAGQLKFVGEGSGSAANSVITTTGSLQLGDKNGEQITCIVLGGTLVAAKVSPLN